MKKIIVNERVLKQVLMEMTKERVLINEITAKDAYDRFYRNRMGEEIFNMAVAGTTNMTPFHKALLDTIINAGQQQGECSPRYVAKSGSDIWIESDPNVRQVLLKAAKSGELNPQIPEEFISRALEISKNKVITRAQVAAEGLAKLFENDNILITCTTTYTASNKYFGDSHWCTASDVFGNYNGLCMFRKYTIRENSVLIQFIPKKKRINGYQIQAAVDGKTRQVCDFMDTGLNVEDMLYNLSDYEPNIKKIFSDIVKQETVKTLFEKTQAAAEEDIKKWSPKIQERLDELSKTTGDKVWNCDFVKPAGHLLSRCYNSGWKEGDGCCYGARLAIYTTLNAPYFLVRIRINTFEFFDEQTASWISSCSKDFDTRNGYSKTFLCKDLGSADENGWKNIEFIREIEGVYGEIMVKDKIIGYSKATATAYPGNDVFTIINGKNGEEMCTKTVVNYANNYIVLSDKVLPNPKSDVDYAPFDIFSTTKPGIVLTNVHYFTVSWDNQLRVRLNGSEGYDYVDNILRFETE